jgi:predicted phosphoribosyltransferase
MFKNRVDAGRQLAERLIGYTDQNVLVVAIPRGGLPLGAIIAKALNAPLDVVLTKKIGHPLNREYAIGAVSLQNKYISESSDAALHYIEEETKRIREILIQRQKQYYKNITPIDVKDKIVIVVDDGVATGNTMLATIALIKEEKPAKIVVAVPVASYEAFNKLNESSTIGDVICLETPENFRAVSQFYEEFDSVLDERAIHILEELNKIIY